MVFITAIASAASADVSPELDPFRVKPIEFASKEVCPVGLECNDDISKPQKGVKFAVKGGPSCPRPPKGNIAGYESIEFANFDKSHSIWDPIELDQCTHKDCSDNIVNIS